MSVETVESGGAVLSSITSSSFVQPVAKSTTEASNKTKREKALFMRGKRQKSSTIIRKITFRTLIRRKT